MTEFNLPDNDDAPWLNCMDALKSSELKTTELSPAAYAVVKAYDSVAWCNRKALAAALRTAANYVKGKGNYELLEIAKELEGSQWPIKYR